MQRRELLGCLGTGAIAVGTTGLARAAADEPKRHQVQHVSKDPRTSCYEQCARLAGLCLAVTANLLASLVARKGDAEALGKIHRALTECREFCELTRTTVMREGLFMKEACSSCADVCFRCADLCDGKDFEWREQVVEDLRECAEICRQVAKE